jgi:hypothetical protein
MTEVERNHEQLHRAFFGDAWHGDAVLELVNGVTTSMALARPISGGHTIWEIVRHITLWNDVVRGRIDGDAVEPGPGDDWPAITETSDTAWKQSLKELSRSIQELEETLNDLSTAKFLDHLPGKDYDGFFLIQGAIQHAAYHGGQIGLIRKAL